MKSVWSMDTKLDEQQELHGEISTDAVIIGAGMAGVLIAHELKRRGVEAVLLERDQTGAGVTKNTTAKITAQHGLIYRKLIADFGVEQAKQYATANQRAVERFAEIIERGAIACDFIRCPSYVYSTSGTEHLYEEAKAACSLGIHAEFTDETTLPFPIKGAVRFPNQASMNPLAFLKGVAQNLTIYEHTEVTDIMEEGVKTSDGMVRAKHIIIATHYPFLDSPGWYFMRMHQQRSYVVALRGAAQLDGMYIGDGPEVYSFRNYGSLLLLGGEEHRTGQNKNGGCYQRLRQAAKRFYPGAEVVAEWSAQDCIPMDGVPYIGRYASSTPNLYVATGFNKWVLSCRSRQWLFLER